MFAALIAVLVLAGLLAFWWSRRRSPPRASTRPQALAQAVSLAPARTPAAAARTDDAAAPPQELHFDVRRLALLESLDAARRQALLVRVREIPRPPHAMHQLLSADFRTRASSTELADLVMTEPVVAARVMGAVNSPLYGLRRPVTSLGQAITFLGLNSVRTLCVQYLMRETLASPNPELRREFELLGRTSALAGELVLLLAKRLQLADAAGLSTQLVLSYLGRFAGALLLHQGQTQGEAPLDAGDSLVQRALAEQQRLGLASSEIGLLLMQEWGLPDSMVRESRGIARVLFAAGPAPDRIQAARAATCALAASVAERVMRQQIGDLAAYDPTTDANEDLQALRRNLPAEMLAQAGEELRSVDPARMAR